jgi:hypothetical protein
MDQSNSIIEALYFKCYYSYLKGNLEDTTMYYAMLRDEFKTGNSKSLMVCQFQELAKVKSALDGGSVSSRNWLEETTPSVKNSNPDMSQKDLVKRIQQEGVTELKRILNAKEAFYLYNIEHPCDQYGYVDMYYQDGYTAFPLEVKVLQGDHNVLGQIMKYDLYCRLHLHEKLYFQVQAVTICGSYDDFTLSELKRNGVIPILYTIRETLNLSHL